MLAGAALLQSAATGGHLARQLASSGFADTTRVGGGNPQLGRLIAQSNRVALMAALDSYNQELKLIGQLIEAEQWDQLEQHLSRGQALRPEFL